MSYKIGDKVRIKSTDWYNKNKDKHGIIICGMMPFCGYMSCRCGTIVTISEILEWGYCIEEDYGENGWTDEMIEGLVEEKTKPKYEDEVNGEYYSTSKYLVRPSGYQFVDENGNVINAMKIVLEKKEKEYPKTYEECSLINGAEGRISLSIIGKFTKLINARNAYWKLYGEEMGLGKPWEPDWLDDDTKKYVITSTKVFETFGGLGYINYILTFPTAEMRGAFYENFKEFIEQCKELL